MKRLQDHLKYFVVNKVTTDPLWQGPKIILSGHEVSVKEMVAPVYYSLPWWALGL